MKLARMREVLEVADVRGHEDPILRERPVVDLVVRRFPHSAIAAFAQPVARHRRPDYGPSR